MQPMDHLRFARAYGLRPLRFRFRSFDTRSSTALAYQVCGIPTHALEVTRPHYCSTRDHHLSRETISGGLVLQMRHFALQTGPAHIFFLHKPAL